MAEGVKYIVGKTPLTLPEVKGMKKHHVPPQLDETDEPFKIVPLKNLGKPIVNTPGIKEIFSRLKIGQGFVIPHKDFVRMQKNVSRFNINAKKLFGSARKFVLEKNINASGKQQKGIGRVGRIK